MSKAGRPASYRPHEVLQFPKTDYNWLHRWCRMHHATWCTVTLRFKCSRGTHLTRLLVFWKNVLRVCFLHGLLESHGELVFEDMYLPEDHLLWHTIWVESGSLIFFVKLTFPNILVSEDAGCFCEVGQRGA